MDTILQLVIVLAFLKGLQWTTVFLWKHSDTLTPEACGLGTDISWQEACSLTKPWGNDYLLSNQKEPTKEQSICPELSARGILHAPNCYFIIIVPDRWMDLKISKIKLHLLSNVAFTTLWGLHFFFSNCKLNGGKQPLCPISLFNLCFLEKLNVHAKKTPVA